MLCVVCVFLFWGWVCIVVELDWVECGVGLGGMCGLMLNES